MTIQKVIKPWGNNMVEYYVYLNNLFDKNSFFFTVALGLLNKTRANVTYLDDPSPEMLKERASMV